MDASDFTHLRVHSYFSFFQATASPAALAKKAADEGMHALALSDTALFGAVKFASACHDVGILPILGITIHVEPFRTKIEIPSSVRPQTVLYALNPAGYRSLCILSTELMKRQWRDDGDHSTLDWDTLFRHSEGLHLLEAGMDGWLARLLASGDSRLVRQYISHIAGVFKDRYSVGLELQSPDQLPIIEAMVEEADRFGVPILAAQPILCLEEEDCELLPVLGAIARNESVHAGELDAVSAAETTPWKPYWRSRDEIGQIFRDWTSAFSNIPPFIEQFQPFLEKGRSSYFSTKTDLHLSANEQLTEQAETGFRARYSQPRDAAIRDRLNRELEAITSLGYAVIFLRVSEITAFARENDIAMNTRGSVANSLVAYCLGITDIDPIEHELIFERFLNPARRDLPDIDLDFCSRRREEVLYFLREKHGVEHVAQVATVNTMRIRSAVREVAKAFGYTQAQIKKLTAGLPYGWSARRGKPRRSSQEVIRSFQNQKDRDVVQMAYRLVGLPDHISLHPGGVVISDEDLVERLPLHFNPAGHLSTQYDKDDLEWIGEPKVDLLGIRSLSVLSEALKWIRTIHLQEGDLLEIPQSDDRTGDMIARGETIGVFQCDSVGARRTLRQLKAQSIQDMAVANAFFKPGPATGGMAGSFIRRYRGEEEVHFLHPALEPILASTKGVLIFQEQIIRVVREIAGLSWEDADRIRRGMSHFKADEMASVRERFLRGCESPLPDGPGMETSQAMQLWDQVQAFSGYGFNKGHATAYANLSFKMAYLKAHWPECLFCARLSAGGGYHPAPVYIAEARRIGIEVLPPHVNHSVRLPTLEFQGHPDGMPRPQIWLGLDQIKDLSRRSIQQIIRERSIQPFTGLMDFASRVALRHGEFENLIKVGAFDRLVAGRMHAIDEIEGRNASQLLLQHQFDFMSPDEHTEDRVRTLFQWEREILSFPVSIDPLDLTTAPYSWQTPLERLAKMNEDLVSTAGYRLPGWMRSNEFLLANRHFWVDARISRGIQKMESPPRSWAPMKFVGRWIEDEWGGGWFQVEATEPLPLAQQS